MARGGRDQRRAQLATVISTGARGKGGTEYSRRNIDDAACLTVSVSRADRCHCIFRIVDGAGDHTKIDQ